MLSIYLAITYDSYYYLKGAPYNRLISAISFPGCHIIWGICTLWVIGACSTGNGGMINRFLGWKGFIPLSRMTYSVYLTHAWGLWLFIGSQRERILTNHYYLVRSFKVSKLLTFILF